MSDPREDTRELQIVDRVVWGGAPPECQKCEQKLLELESDGSWERAATVATEALLGPIEQPPEPLMRKLEFDAAGFFAHKQGLSLPALEQLRGTIQQADIESASPRRPTFEVVRDSAGVPPSQRRTLQRLLVAAVVILGFSLAWQLLVSQPTPSERRTALMASGADFVTAQIAKGTSARSGSPTGDIVWSRERQEGYIRLSGLPVNDPGREQYQLWIVDAGRPGSAPVDGGVFDMPRADGDVVIPIRAPITVHGEVQFAITLEAPGGVVVSKKEHVVAVAS